MNSSPFSQNPFHHQIAEEWPIYAATAWHFYQQKGRGLVYFGEPNLETETLAYLTAQDASWPESVQAKLDQYDPTQEVVFFLQSTEEEWFCWISTGDPTPPAAYHLHDSPT
jgi:hypothetical protein